MPSRALYTWLSYPVISYFFLLEFLILRRHSQAYWIRGAQNKRAKKQVHETDSLMLHDNFILRHTDINSTSSTNFEWFMMLSGLPIRHPGTTIPWSHRYADSTRLHINIINTQRRSRFAQLHREVKLHPLCSSVLFWLRRINSLWLHA